MDRICSLIESAHDLDLVARKLHGLLLIVQFINRLGGSIVQNELSAMGVAVELKLDGLAHHVSYRFLFLQWQIVQHASGDFNKNNQFSRFRFHAGSIHGSKLRALSPSTPV